MRIIKDSEGNDVQVFVKEDKANGLRKDSSFYADGSWEVMETNETAKIIKYATSHGLKILNLHDKQWRVTNKIMTKNNDTIFSDQYFWKGNKLIKTRIDGVERIYIYGNSSQDTIKVIPSDNEGQIFFHSGYNNTIGRIPDEKDPEYKYFVKNPYAVYGKFPKNISSLQQGMPILFKLNNVSESYSRLLEPKYKNPSFKECIDKNIIYGYNRGYSNVNPYLDAKCQTDTKGCYYVDYSIKPINKSMTIYQSHIAYDNTNKKWQRYCVSQSELNLTFIHEMQHINNAEYVMSRYAEDNMLKKMNSFDTKDECNRKKDSAENIFWNKWSIWYEKEREHKNKLPEDLRASPQQRNFVFGEICDVNIP